MISKHLVNDEIPEIPVDSTQMRQACKDMLRIRQMEGMLSGLYQMKNIRGFCHLSVGQEAISVGLGLAIDPKDTLITSYRCHALALVSGMDPKEIVCEQVGSVDGCSRGKGGSMHLYGKRFLGGHGIVGAQVSLGLGAAFAEKYKVLLNLKEAHDKNPLSETGPVGEWTQRAWNVFGCKNISVAVFGDGAANQGQIYESFNMAALWKLPIVFVCENNRYGMGTPVSRASASTEFYNRFSFMPGIRVDSSDVHTLYTVFKYARDHALTKGPILIECVTYRYNGHSMTDAFSGYRTSSEIEQHKQNDPIELVKRHLGETAERVVAELNESAHREMASIKEVALNSPRCPFTDLFTDILK
ncbi:pyruvate dehydrogenase E1 component alpha subunit [Nematocida sp. AWRm80]|nr:pyruvate dehydrogenase E1 component alpha subunit [Nematocida sp. AWRm80]